MIVKSTCPRDCYDRCGLLIHVEGGRVSKVVGDPSHPSTKGAICAKCATAYNGIWLDERARLTNKVRL
ncbi:hypothetical protein [Sulfuriferula nivalis]|uniref:hypothetical protein n=1 Tax=Sulfuriferula nivalis TaxID=2675298 RepID=UPI0013896E67